MALIILGIFIEAFDMHWQSKNEPQLTPLK